MSGPRPKRLEGPSGPFRVFGLVSDQMRLTWRYGDAGQSRALRALSIDTNSPRRLFAGDAGWSSPVARQAHNLKVVGSNPTPATTNPFNYNYNIASLSPVGLFALAGDVLP
jgi:hypothetical protein